MKGEKDGIGERRYEGNEDFKGGKSREGGVRKGRTKKEGNKEGRWRLRKKSIIMKEKNDVEMWNKKVAVLSPGMDVLVIESLSKEEREGKNEKRKIKKIEKKVK